MYSCRLRRMGAQSGGAGEGTGETFEGSFSDAVTDEERNLLRKAYDAGDLSFAGRIK